LGGTTSGAGLFAQGSTVTAVATANAGFTFFNWTDGTTVASTSASYQFAMAGNRTLVANFTPRYVVTVLSNPILGGVTSGGGTFNSGTSVTVTAVPNAGFTFTNWTDGVNIVSTAANYQFTIAANRTLVANYAAIPYTVAVSSNPLLGGTTTGGGTFNSGASVTVAAVANIGFTFTNWTEGINIVSTDANYLFTIAGNRTLVANYTATLYTVAVSSNPLLGGTTTGGGTFNSGTSVTVTAVPNVGFTFTNWTEGANIVSTNANYLFTITGNRTLVANYSAMPFTIAVSSNPLAGGTTSGSGVFNAGTQVTVSTNANVGYSFTNWTEGTTVVSTNANYQFTVSGNRILVANYIPITYTVAVSSNPLIGGTTSGGGTFNHGASVTVHAVANTGYTFTNWTEGLIPVSTNANYLFTITGNRTLVANYTINTYTLNVTATHGTVLKSPATGPYNYGTTVTLTPTPETGYTFTSWSVDATGSDNPLTVTMNANKNITANFTINTYTLNVTAIHGTVAKSPATGPYNYGTTVTLTPTPETGYTFTSWSVDATGSDNPLTVTMNANKNITANFTAIPPSAARFSSIFGAFGGNAGITNQGIYTVINDGSIGTTAASTLITGFHDRTGDSYTETTLNIGNVTGWIYTAPPPPVIPSVGATGGTATTFAIAQAGLLAASDFYISISPANRPGGITLSTSELGGRTLAPGTYVSGSSYDITTLDLTLDAQGDANAEWFFQVPTALTVGTPSGARSVLMINGGLPKNVYWYVGSQAVINYGGGGTMVGTIIANSGVTLSSPGNSTNSTPTVLNGRAISLVSSVTMVNTTINVPAP
ncbi:MAG: ice-binding family protein, partial [Bacteroidota bacterium]